MALGSNMKRKKLIPDEPAEKEKKEKLPTVEKQKEKELKKKKNKVEKKAAKKSTDKLKKKKQEEPKKQSDPTTSRSESPDKNLTLTIKPSRRKSIKKVWVIMEGKLLINNVEFAWDLIQPLFKDYNNIAFELENISDIDMTFIQMIYYARELHAGKGIEVTCDAKLPDNLDSLISGIGYKSLLTKQKLA